MKFKIIYWITIILSFFGVFFLLFVKDPYIYSLYGYDPSIIGSTRIDALEAIADTALQGLRHLV